MVQLNLIEKRKEALNFWSFFFDRPEKFSFQAGQFFQITISHKDSDSRGIKRFFTMASSPTEDFLMITTKISDNPSTFKKALMELPVGSTLDATAPKGSFVLPAKITPCVLIAGGIGVTPYRSMVKFVTDQNLKIPLKLIYASRVPDEIAFFDFFQKTEKQNKFFKCFYTITKPELSRMKWKGRIGRINEDLIKEVAGEMSESIFYLSGPKPMVDSYTLLLYRVGIKRELVRADYFPGYENEKDY